MRVVILAVCLFVAVGCETVDNPAHSPLFDQVLMMNGHYGLVYPEKN